MTRTIALGVQKSLSGRAWRWRDPELDCSGLQPEDLITRILLSRGAARDRLDDFRRPSLRAFMPDPSRFADMDKAADRLADAVERGESITVYGDYDVDGATSAALLIRLLRQMGRKARPYIPDRLLEGYGPSAEALVRLKRRDLTWL